MFKDEPDNLADLATGEDCLPPRLLLPRQLGLLLLIRCLLAAQGTDCQRGELLCSWDKFAACSRGANQIPQRSDTLSFSPGKKKP